MISERMCFFESPPVLPLFPTFYHNECFPLVLLEAMEHGLPCISTTEGEYQELLMMVRRASSFLSMMLLCLLTRFSFSWMILSCAATWARSAGRNLKRSLRWMFLRKEWWRYYLTMLNVKLLVHWWLGFGNISFIPYLLGSVCQGIDIIVKNAAMNKALCAWIQ